MVNQYLKGVITIPSSLLITNITRSLPMIVDVSIGNPKTDSLIYREGMAIKLFVPKSYGMYQANNLIGIIIEINGNSFKLNIDSNNFDDFVIPSPNEETPASISPFGSRNLEYDNSTNKVPFQSLNNKGN